MDFRRTAMRLVACVALGVGLSACAVGPRYAPPVGAGVPAAYPAVTGAALSTAPASDAWWAAFNDARLDELIATALAGGPDLLAAEARVTQARELALAAGAVRYPVVSLDGRVGRDKLSLNGENLALIPFRPAHSTFTDYRIGFDASWELDLFGHSRHQVEAAIARSGSAAESGSDARVVLSAEVARNYANYATAVQRIEVARAAETAYAQTAHLVDLQHAAGVASDLELNRARADELSSTTETPALEADRQAALFRLAALTGQTAQAIEPHLAGVRPLQLPPGVLPAGLPADLLRRRPDVRRAERELAAATADAGVAVAEQFPRISLVGSAGLDSVHPGELTQAASRYWSIGPQISVPIFSAGRLRHQAKAADAAREAALQTYRSTVLGALADAETALVRYASDVRRSEAVRGAVRADEGTLALTQLRYRVGEATLLEVMDAERVVCALNDQLAVVAGQVALDYVALQKALGGGWQ